MKYTDNILLIAAAYSLYTLTLIFSTKYFSDFSHLIPDIFSGRASITITQTFHMVIGSIVTSMLLVRFAAKPVLIAFLVAVAINIEGYLLLLSKYPLDSTLDYYLANPSEVLVFLKPIVILPVFTYLIGLIKRFEPPETAHFDE